MHPKCPSDIFSGPTVWTLSKGMWEFKTYKDKHGILGFQRMSLKAGDVVGRCEFPFLLHFWKHWFCYMVPWTNTGEGNLIRSQYGYGIPYGRSWAGPWELKAFAQQGLRHLVMFITGSQSIAGFHRMVEVILASRLGSLKEVWPK